MLLTVHRECWTPCCSQLGIECTREACNKQMVSGLNYGREHTTECSYDRRSQQHRDRLSAPFLHDPTAFFFFLPDLKLVHSSEKTNIERPGFTLQSLCLSLCWGWGVVLSTVGGFLEHTIDSVGNYEVHVLSWLKEMSPQHLSLQICAQGKDTWQTLSPEAIFGAWYTLGLQYMLSQYTDRD